MPSSLEGRYRCCSAHMRSQSHETALGLDLVPGKQVRRLQGDEAAGKRSQLVHALASDRKEFGSLDLLVANHLTH